MSVRWQVAPIFQTRAFNAADYSAIGGGNDWTVSVLNVETARYAIIGNLLYVILSIINSDITGTPNTIQMTLPESRTAKSVSYHAAQADAGGGSYEPIQAFTAPGETQLRFQRFLGVTWDAVGGVAVGGTFVIELGLE